MTMQDLIANLLLDAFAASDGALFLQLEGDAAADALEAWAKYRRLSVETECRQRQDEGREIHWQVVRVHLTPLKSAVASRGDKTVHLALDAALERACRTVTRFDYTDVNGKLDAEASAFPTDTDKDLP